jgi:hypothetical protein
MKNWFRSHFPLKNLMLLTVRSFLLQYPETLTYSQEHMAKKKVPINNLFRGALSDDNEADILNLTIDLLSLLDSSERPTKYVMLLCMRTS